MILEKPNNLLEYHIENELILVPIVNNVAQMEFMYVLNDSAAFIWSNVEKFEKVEELSRAMSFVFDVPETDALNDIYEFIEDIKNLANKT